MLKTVLYPVVDVTVSYSRRTSYSVATHPVIGYVLCEMSPRARCIRGSALSSLAIATCNASSVVVGGRGGMRSVSLPLHCARSSAGLVFGCDQAGDSAVIVHRAGAPCFLSVSYNCRVGRTVADMAYAHVSLSSVCVGSGRTNVCKGRGLGLFC